MFREMRRKKNQLPREEAVRLLKTEPRGVLSVLGDGGYPYSIPMDHWYEESDGCLYFHSAKVGHKIDAIRACPKVSYCVFDQGARAEGDWALYIKSAVVFGKMEFVTEQEETVRILRRIAHKFTPDGDFVEREIRENLENVQILRLVPEQITCKGIMES